MPVLSLERHMLAVAEEIIRFLSRVRCILTDMGTGRLMANMVDCLPELFQLMGAPAQGRTLSIFVCRVQAACISGM